MIIPSKSDFPAIIFAAQTNERWSVEQTRAALYAYEEWYTDRNEHAWARMMYDAGIDVDRIATERWPDWQKSAYMFLNVKVPKIGDKGFAG